MPRFSYASKNETTFTLANNIYNSLKVIINISLKGLQFPIVAHEAIPVEDCRGEFYNNNIIMAVQASTLVIIRKMI